MENSDAYTAVSHGFPFFFFFSELDNKYFFPSVFSPVVKKKDDFYRVYGRACDSSALQSHNHL